MCLVLLSSSSRSFPMSATQKDQLGDYSSPRPVSPWYLTENRLAVFSENPWGTETMIPSTSPDDTTSCYGFSAPEAYHVCREDPSPHFLTWPLRPQTALLVSAYGKSFFSFFLIAHGPQMRIRKLSSQRCPIPHNCSPNANQFLHISDYQFPSSLITTQTLKFSLGSAGTL